MNGLRYAAGYDPMLRRTLLKSLKKDVILCSYDLLGNGNKDDYESQDWVHSRNRGGLTLINNAAFATSIVHSDNVHFCGLLHVVTGKRTVVMPFSRWLSTNEETFLCQCTGGEIQAANKNTTQKLKTRKQACCSDIKDRQDQLASYSVMLC